MPHQEIAKSLLDLARKAKAAAQRATVQAPFQAPPSRRKPRRCGCGSCSLCLDNAKWERIFHEKFADESYYSEPTFHFNSSLSWLG